MADDYIGFPRLLIWCRDVTVITGELNTTARAKNTTDSANICTLCKISTRGSIV